MLTYRALRSEMPMNIRATRKVDLSSEALKDIGRIDEIFAQQQDVFPNECFFGDFSIADAMYVPIVLRLKTYQIKLSPEAQQYCDFVMLCPVLQVWITQALTETDIVECDEAGTPV